MEYDLEGIIKELTNASQPPPYTVAQPATMSVAKQLFGELKAKNIYPEIDEVLNLLIKYNWEDQHANYFLKKFKAYLR